jgi:hypothetical protein
MGARQSRDRRAAEGLAESRSGQRLLDRQYVDVASAHAA